MGILPIRSDNAYVGLAQQSGQGVPVAPSYFIRWLDGTKLEFDMKVTDVWEGDGGRHVSQLIKNHQMVKMTMKLNPRPVELGFLEAAALGSGADSFTTATISTTVSATISAGANSIQIPSNAGLTGSGTQVLVVGAGSVNEEVATFSIPTTGAGPYTLTVASGGSLKKPHNSGEIVRSYSLHTLTDQVDSPYYTIEYGLGSLNGSAGITLRVTDCKCESIKREAKAGGIFEIEMEWIGIATVEQAVPSTVTYENHNVFLYSQTNGNWTLNGSTSGDANAVEGFTFTQKNGVDTSIQAEQLTLGALIFGNLDLKVSVDVIMQSASLINLVYFGGTSGLTDAQAIGAGNLVVAFTQPDGFHTVTYTIPTLHYDKTKMPEPKKDGKHYKIGMEGVSTSNQSQNTYLIQCAIQNTKNVSY